LVDAYEWLKENLEIIVGVNNISIRKYALIGESAGALNVLLCGFLFKPAPLAINATYSPTDFTLQLASLPIVPVPLSGHFSEEEVLAMLHHPKPEDTISMCPYGIQKDSAPVLVEKITGIKGYAFGFRESLQFDAAIVMYNHGTTVATLLKESTGAKGELLPLTQDQLIARKKWSPYHMLNGRTTFPPTYLLTGDADVLVNFNQSVRFKEKMDEKGFDCEIDVIHSVGHVMDQDWHEREDKMNNEVRKVVAFMNKHVQA